MGRIEDLEAELAAEKALLNEMPTYDEALEAYRADPENEDKKNAMREAAAKLDEVRTKAAEIRQANQMVIPLTATASAEAHEPGV